MLRYLPVMLLACVMLSSPFGGAIAQSKPTVVVKSVTQQNPLIDDVARNDPDGLRNLLQRLEILTTGQRDSGPARSGSTPTAQESAQIAANPLLSEAYAKDRAATLALLRATNEELDRARRREPLEQHRRVALVIGNSGDRTWGTLDTAGNDAALITNVLLRQGFEVFAGHPWLDLDRRQLLATIRAFSRSITPGSVALIYYAGHGVRSGGRNFLVPANAAIPAHDEDYDRDLVAIDDMLLRPMQQANGALTIIVLDACESRSVPSSSARRDAHGSGSGIAPITPRGNGTIIISSTGPNDVALDRVGHAPDSPFATAFATAISEPGLEIRDVFDRVEAMVDHATNHQQRPWIAYSAIGRFYFGAPARTAAYVPNIALDDGPFHCPAPGTTVTLDVPAGAVTGAYETTDPSDPVICRIVTTGGESKSLLYNFYDAGSLIGRQAPIRKGMDDLLSKHADQVSFEIFYSFSSRIQETWKRIGIETLPIDGRYVQTVKFERTSTLYNSFLGAQVPGRWLIWYDPVADVFVKSERQTPNAAAGLGAGMSGAFKVISVTHD
jgi:Caspase domain